MYRIIPGDATNPQPLNKDSEIWIPHVCNDLGLWGSGFVNAITARWGESARTAYIMWSKAFKNTSITLSATDTEIVGNSYFVLGGHQALRVLNSPDKIHIYNMIAQHGVRGDDSLRPPIRYAALAESMASLTPLLRSNSEIHCPKFGSDLAGGKWEVIEALIHELWVDEGYNVTVYEFQPKVSPENKEMPSLD